MRLIFWVLLSVAFGAAANAAEPTCSAYQQKVAPNSPQCFETATDLQNTDIVYGVQGTGPSRSNQSVKIPISQLKDVAAGAAPVQSVAGHTGIVTLSASDISGLAASATTDTTSATNITSGTLPAARLPTPASTTLGGIKSSSAPTNQFATGVDTAGAVTYARPSAANVSGLAASATTDTTSAANITSGTLPAARLSGVDTAAATITATGGNTAITHAVKQAQVVNVLDFGGKGDLISFFDGVYSAGTATITSAFAPCTAGTDTGKAMEIPGADPNGLTLLTTITGCGGANTYNLAAAPSASSTNYFVTAANVTAGGSGYAPNDTLTMSNGTVLTVWHTKVMSVAIVSAGTGGTTTSDCVIAGTTGTGRVFRVHVAISGGGLSSIGTIAEVGSYSVNPTNLAAEPVTPAGCGALTGATVSLTMGVAIPKVTYPGIWASAPSGAQFQTATSGSGTGATFTLRSNIGGVYASGSDNTAAISAAVALVNTHYSQGHRACVYFPSRDARYTRGGGYFVASPPTHFGTHVPGCILGDGYGRSKIRLSAGFTGDLFTWQETWLDSSLISPYAGTMPMSRDEIGPAVYGITVIGDTAAPSQQNAFVLYDHVDEPRFVGVRCAYVAGNCLSMGLKSIGTVGSTREGRFIDMRFESSGRVDVPALYIVSQGPSGNDPTNGHDFIGLDLLRCIGKCMVIENQIPNTGGAIRALKFSHTRAELSLSGDDLIQIGTRSSYPVIDVSINDVTLAQGQVDHALIRLSAINSSSQPYNIRIRDGSGAQGAGNGVVIDYGRLITVDIGNFSVSQKTYVVGPNGQVGGGLFLLPSGQQSLTMDLDRTSVANLASYVVSWGAGNTYTGTGVFGGYLPTSCTDQPIGNAALYIDTADSNRVKACP